MLKFQDKAYVPELVFWLMFLAFTAILYYNMVVGLTGIGCVLTMSSVIILNERKAIWANYKKSYKKPKSQFMRSWGEPKDLYYRINVAIILPLVFLTGVAAIVAAFVIS